MELLQKFAPQVSFRASAHTGVGIRSLFAVQSTAPPSAAGDADCHTSDIGHWFAMTHYWKVSA